MGISLEQRFDLGKNREEIVSQYSLWQYRPKQSTQHGPDKHSERYAKKGIDDGLRRHRLLWIESYKRAYRYICQLYPKVNARDSRGKKAEREQDEEHRQIHDGIVCEKRRRENEQRRTGGQHQ